MVVNKHDFIINRNILKVQKIKHSNSNYVLFTLQFPASKSVTWRLEILTRYDVLSQFINSSYHILSKFNNSICHKFYLRTFPNSLPIRCSMFDFFSSKSYTWFHTILKMKELIICNFEGCKGTFAVSFIYDFPLVIINNDSVCSTVASLQILSSLMLLLCTQ